MNKRLINLLIILISIMVVNTQTIFATETKATLEPMSVLLLGIDTGSLGRVEVGRSDVIMVMTINPKTNHITLTSIPRDTYVEIVGQGVMDKINHAYAFGGVEMARDTVEHLFEIQIDNYIVVNMAGLCEIIDSLGGIKVVPPTSFEIDGNYFYEGEEILIDGEETLSYVRERYTSGGDYARQERQRQVVSALINKLVKNKKISNYKNLYLLFSNNVKTDIDFLSLLNIMEQKNFSSFEIEYFQLIGISQMIDGIYYEIPDDTSINTLRSMFDKHL
ncbi:LCP family protein [Globicatella sanguinis]|uniref:LCP family protein n=1 Tax=Globicatella sanguinis TaxID=13076 RepID=UPI0008258189|nr:LCP family protein [Globicatella sanguinis]